MAVPPASEASAEHVVQQVLRMHKEPQHATQISQWLEQFQQSQNAWNIVNQILSEGKAADPQAALAQEVVVYFAAQTLTRKVQSAALDTCRDYDVSNRLQVLVKQFADTGPQTVLTQMIVALAALAAVDPGVEVQQILGWYLFSNFFDSAFAFKKIQFLMFLP